MQDLIERARREAEAGWREIHRGAFWRHVRERGIDRELYVALMTEIYHYTRHNAQNQALAATTVDSGRVTLLRYCLAHALDEAGHDLMVLHDLKAIGVDPETVRASTPLAETQAFVAYLYRTASTRDATARLGYSFWAESCYPYIAEVLDAMRAGLGLTDAQMTFFVAHSEIDRDHAEQVEQIARAHCATAKQQADFLEVLRGSLRLQGAILEALIRARIAREAPVEVGA